MELEETMSREDALDIMWAAHVPPYVGRDKAFFYANLLEPVEMHEWNGNHPVEENINRWTAEAGTTVLVTVYSRFGDVGFRARDLEKVSPRQSLGSKGSLTPRLEHGYDARVDPETLINWRRAQPSPRSKL